MTMREKMARAIAGPGPWEKLPACRPYCLSIADDCLRAMREPDKAIIDATWEIFAVHWGAPREQARDTWQAMIDAALEGK